MNCQICGKEIEGKRSDSRFCSDSCRQKNQRQKTMVTTQKFEYKPRQSYNVGSNAINTLTGFINPGFQSGLGANVNKGLSGLTKPNNPWLQLITIGFGAVGAFVGYSLLPTKKTSSLTYILCGAGIGIVVGQIAQSLFLNFTDYYEQKSIFELQQIEQIQGQQLQGISSTLLSPADFIYHSQPTIRIDGAFADLLGENLNYHFKLMAYGKPGSGKSYFATMLASYLQKIGRVLFVLSEESASNTVSERIQKYNLGNNVQFIITRNPDEIAQHAELGRFQFLIIDSLSALPLSYKEQVEFVQNFNRFPELLGSLINCQVTKEDDFAGANSLLHYVDTEVFVEDGIAITRKNRFNASGKRLNIFNDNQKIQKLDYRSAING